MTISPQLSKALHEHSLSGFCAQIAIEREVEAAGSWQLDAGGLLVLGQRSYPVQFLGSWRSGEWRWANEDPTLPRPLVRGATEVRAVLRAKQSPEAGEVSFPITDADAWLLAWAAAGLTGAATYMIPVDDAVAFLMVNCLGGPNPSAAELAMILARFCQVVSAPHLPYVEGWARSTGRWAGGDDRSVRIADPRGALVTAEFDHLRRLVVARA